MSRRPLFLSAVGLTIALLAGTGAAAAESPPRAAVTAAVETPAEFDDEAGGNSDADDPAIWVDPSDPARSLVIGTLKEGGLAVYDLAGRQLQRIAPPAPPTADDAPGRFNNVDVAYGVRLGRTTADLAIVSDRGRDQLRIYRIDGTRAARPLVDVTAPDVPFAFNADQAAVNDQSTAYGLTTTVDGGTAWTVVSRRSSTQLGLFRLVNTARGVSYQRADTLTLPGRFRLPNGTTWTPCDEPGVGPQVEGVVVDPVAGVLYAAQEDVALWKIDLRNHRFGAARIVEKVKEFGVPGTYDAAADECAYGANPGYGGTRITADVEGLAIYADRYLLVSSQGDSGFLVYDRRTLGYLGRYDVTDGAATDGVQHSDGTAVVHTRLNATFPAGLLVVHDGENTPAADGRANTNFKLLDWRAVAKPLRLAVTPSAPGPR
ncbi:phytase [Cryptosporangium aurantiacum]|uniref:3-phytase n=1 Tax=Cryptosporangium aurantiacum TaxID=134849 RepID=A0A1M7RNN9_9ACTN|nr:phytase [Cryptosporangium aurantiacum]SHN47874.1 3-phytase [Cryptosporangium aurantiacum]